jgi:hypothetical protein
MRLIVIRSLQLLVLAVFGLTAIGAQAPAGARFTATTANVGGAGEPIKINLTGWSTDAQRDEFVAAWSLTAPAAGAPGQGRGARGGRGSAAGARGARGGRGARGDAPAASDIPADPDAPDADSPAARFGRGGARGGAADDAGARTPEASLAAVIKKAATVGILWTSENAGYSIKFAYRLPQPDGGERIILATDRRVGAWSNLWKPAGSAAAGPDYAFSLIELRVNSKGEGEGKGPLGGKVTIDTQAKSIAVDSYDTLPVVFKGLKRLGV